MTVAGCLTEVSIIGNKKKLELSNFEPILTIYSRSQEFGRDLNIALIVD